MTWTRYLPRSITIDVGAYWCRFHHQTFHTRHHIPDRQRSTRDRVRMACRVSCRYCGRRYVAGGYWAVRKRGGVAA